MKKFFSLATGALFSLILFPCLLLAQEVVAPALPVPVVDPNMDFLNLLMQSLGGIKGASALAIAGIVVKLLLKALDLPLVAGLMGKAFKDWASGLKLTVVLALSYVAGVIGLMVPPTSLSLGAALVHSSTLAAFVVLSNQVYKHWIEKKPAA